MDPETKERLSKYLPAYWNAKVWTTIPDRMTAKTSPVESEKVESAGTSEVLKTPLDK